MRHLRGSGRGLSSYCLEPPWQAQFRAARPRRTQSTQSGGGTGWGPINVPSHARETISAGQGKCPRSAPKSPRGPPGYSCPRAWPRGQGSTCTLAATDGRVRSPTQPTPGQRQIAKWAATAPHASRKAVRRHCCGPGQGPALSFRTQT